ncbi:GNAT family N-acetyltransferase [Geminicoccus roseus]|uniref:GNAT family N-acetyltransferase n=1 Tax=Geminicoccus roseus TaxID=404900 RepID=UPI000404D841|nr:GNAT family N-acetyltransferase [Geminicoccus roseus]
MTITIRDLCAADHELMVRWTLDFFADLKATGDPYFQDAQMRREVVEREMTLPLPSDHLGVIALRDSRPAGYLTGRLERPFVRESPIWHVGHVGHVYVAPDHRRHGVAQALLAHAESWFRARRVGWMQLSWQPGNQLADAAWRASGFEPYRVHGRRRIDAVGGQEEPQG